MIHALLHRAAARLPSVEGPFAGHRERCLSCQAAGVRERALTRALEALREEIVPAPIWFADAVLASLDRPERSRRRSRLVPGLVAGGATVAAAAVVTVLARKKVRPAA